MVGRAAPKSPWRCCRPRGGPRTQSPQHQRGRAATLTTAIYAHLDDAALGYAAFAQGWYGNGRAWGRPADILEAPDGSLMVSDDRVGRIYRIRYVGR